ncbi:MAG: hypothetical protein JW874_07410 [Spirochaetales bacterium]|nr:hypothetical protein [Spirochaetales bacterium]
MKNIITAAVILTILVSALLMHRRNKSKGTACKGCCFAGYCRKGNDFSHATQRSRQARNPAAKSSIPKSG